MKSKKMNEEQTILRTVCLFSIIALVASGIWGYAMWKTYHSIQDFSDETLTRYQTERVEIALARDFVEEQLSASTTITHESRNGNIFYFQGEEEGKGSFMFIVEQTEPAVFTITSGVSSINISTEQ